MRDAEREREVLLRVSMANDGPLPQADLLALYRRLFVATRALEAQDRARAEREDGTGDDSERLIRRRLPCGGRGSPRPRPVTLHLGHVANAVFVWGLAALDGAQVLLRIEDHDRQRSRPEYDAAVLEDLAWLGFVADTGPVRQTDPASTAAYEAALEELRGADRIYGCACTRSTFETWGSRAGRPWFGSGCPGGCRSRGPGRTPAVGWRWATAPRTGTTRSLGPHRGSVAIGGDPPVRDREGNWTYGFCVVVDDARQAIDLVVRGEDLLDATPGQLALGRPSDARRRPSSRTTRLVRRADGSKLSKSAGDAGVRELRSQGSRPRS